MKKKLLALLLGLTLCLSLAACGGSTDDTAADDTADTAGDDAAETVTLTVAASPTPHAVILEQCVPILAEQGIDLVINEYSDYVVPNTAVEDGDEDANYFQHIPYLEEFNETRGTHLVDVASVHIEPMGVYAGKTASLEELADGAVIAIPNDATNEGRALLLLEAQGHHPQRAGGRGPGGHQFQLRSGRRPEPHHGRSGHRVQRLPLCERAGGQGGQ